MSNLKFGPISEKMEGVVVEGQYAPGCACDCTETAWKSSASSSKKGCYTVKVYTASGNPKH